MKQEKKIFFCLTFRLSSRKLDTTLIDFLFNTYFFSRNKQDTYTYTYKKTKKKIHSLTIILYILELMC